MGSIGVNDDALLCLTGNTACCSRTEVPGEGILGDWYYPNGTVVPNSILEMTSEMWDFYRNRGLSVVRMHRRRDGVTGIYRCEIPDAMGANQIMYIGVYTASTGEWYMCTHVLYKSSHTAVLVLVRLKHY